MGHNIDRRIIVVPKVVKWLSLQVVRVYYATPQVDKGHKNAFSPLKLESSCTVQSSDYRRPYQLAFPLGSVFNYMSNHAARNRLTCISNEQRSIQKESAFLFVAVNRRK